MYMMHDYKCRQCGKTDEHFVDITERGDEIIRCPHCEDGIMDRQLGVGTIKGGDTPKFRKGRVG